jgi:WD40 repeat protein
MSSEGEAVIVWEAATGKELCTLEGWGEAFEAIAFSSDGKFVAANNRSPSDILVWQLDPLDLTRNRIPKVILRGHSSWGQRLVFSPDGRRLLSTAGAYSSTTGELKIWDTTIGQELLTLKTSGIDLQTAQFSPDGHRLLALYADAKRPGSPLRVWDATPLPETGAKGER